MSKRRTGLNSMAYMGVEASSPPQCTVVNRAPLISDYTQYNLGHIWIHDAGVAAADGIWMLIDKRRQVATWVQINIGGGIPTFPCDVGQAVSVGGVTNILGAWNINTIGAGNTVDIYLDTSIHQPNSNAAGTEGVYYLGAAAGVGGNTFMHNYGTQNSFVGQSSGNFDVDPATARSNTGLGFQVMTQNVLGDYNLGAGSSSLATIADGDYNVSLGAGNLSLATDIDFNTSAGAYGLQNLRTGSYNISLGYRSAINYTTNESSNIIIGNEGTILDANEIRIGTEGNGAGQQNSCHIAGVYNSVVGATSEIVTVDSTGKIGSTDVDLNGYLLISAAAASPAWAALGSSDGSVVITRGPNAIDLVAVGGGGGGGATTFITDVAGPAVIDGANITVIGDGIIETDGTVAHTVTVTLPGDTHGDILMTDVAGDTVWGNITSTGGSVNITYPNPPGSTINLEAAGLAATTTFHTDAGDAIQVAGTINVYGGANIATIGAGQTVTINLEDSITLPMTNATGTEGMYELGVSRFMHNYGPTGTDYNTFLGEDAGNLTLTSVDSVGIGFQSLEALTSGAGNTAVSSGSGRALTTGQNNVSVGLDSLYTASSGSSNCTLGAFSLSGIVAGSNNTCLGFSAGGNCTAGDSSNILIAHMGSAGLNNTIKIGTQGVAAGQQDTTFIAGIYGVAPPGGAVQGVIIDANGQLGSAEGGEGPINSVVAGTNIILTGTIYDPIINVTDNVVLAGSLTAGTGVTATLGDITADAGDLVATLGDVIANDATFANLGRGVVQSSAIGELSSNEGINGQLLISQTGAAPAWNTLTAGAGIAIDNATVPGQISISATGGGGGGLGIWNTFTVPDNDSNPVYHYIAYLNGEFVAIGLNGIILHTANPLGVWTSINNGILGIPIQIIYDGGFYVIIYSGSRTVAYSATLGGVWSTTTYTASTQTARQIVYGAGYYVIASANDSTPYTGHWFYATTPGGPWTAIVIGGYSFIPRNVTYDGTNHVGISFIGPGSGLDYYVVLKNPPSGGMSSFAGPINYAQQKLLYYDAGDYYGVTASYVRQTAAPTVSPWNSYATSNILSGIAQDGTNYVTSALYGNIMSSTGYANTWYANITGTGSGAYIGVNGSPFTSVAYGNNYFVAVGGAQLSVIAV